MKRISKWGLVVAGMLVAGCGSISNPGSFADRELLHSRVEAALADFRAADPTLETLMARAHAYVIFPQIVSAAVGLGGAHGDGEVYQGGRLIGYADVSQASIGAQLGGQKYAELILFETQSALLDFQNGTVEFDARATAVAASKGAASTANYQHGVMVFTLPEGGLMAQAAIGGQKFRYRPVSMP
jgi:lipid-binding SYLF domain-containing protein